MNSNTPSEPVGATEGSTVSAESLADPESSTDGAASDPTCQPHEHHLTTTRAARYFVLGTPSPLVRECWVVLHGYGQLAARFIRNFTAAISPQRLFVAPEALSRFYVSSDVTAHAQSRVGASWMTREDRLAEINDHVGFLDTVWTRVADGLDSANVKLGVLGFSQGAATASRWTALGVSPVRRLVLWGGAVPDDLPLDTLRDRLSGETLALVMGDHDRFSSAARLTAQLERLRGHRIPTTLSTFVGGHRMDAAALARVLADFESGS